MVTIINEKVNALSSEFPSRCNETWLKLWIGEKIGYENHVTDIHFESCFYKLLQLVSLAFSQFEKVSSRLSCSDTITDQATSKTVYLFLPALEAGNP